jgi:hypothetical protein
LADDQNEQAQPDASQRPFDEVWWNDYQAQVNKSIIAAEQHLDVPSGTISSIPSDPDFIATVKMYAVIEPILNDLIASWQSQPPALFGGIPSIPSLPLDFEQPARENFRTFVTGLNIDGRTSKLELAKGLGLLAQDRIAFIRAVAQVRHRYAHNLRNMHRSLEDIVTEEQRTNGRIVEHLTGIKLLPSQSFRHPEDRNLLIKVLMYFRLADYLSDALHTLRPPPLPESTRSLLGLGPLAVSAPEVRSLDDVDDETER